MNKDDKINISFIEHLFYWEIKFVEIVPEGEFVEIKIHRNKMIYILNVNRVLYKYYYSQLVQADVAEWLRRLTRNQLGFARVGSNPAGRLLLLQFVEHFLHNISCNMI